MRNLIMLCLAVAYTLQGFAADIYAVSLIPEELKKNANAVKRFEEYRFQIHSLTGTSIKYKYAFTILNASGDSYAQFYEHYDKLRKIASIEGNLYDASGKLLKKLKPKDIEDRSATDEISLADDNRIKRHNFYHRLYPYTVEYEVEIKGTHTFYLPSWYTMEGENLSVQSSSYTVIVPLSYQLRYKAFNYNGEPAILTEKNLKTYTWSVKNLTAIKKETNGPKWHELTTTVLIAPTEFQLDDYKGNMTSWEEFGKFLNELGKGKDVLPENIKQQVRQLTAKAGSDVEKIKILYEFMQKNTRYISIQLGIGGWQPFEASYVASKGYGDCKALSNYMYSLLKEAGIKSHYTLIMAGDFDNIRFPDFPMSQFNHAILCVPVKNDTIWLECTSQIDPAGYMGSFTGNRKALILTDEGGKLVQTKLYKANDNLQLRKINATIDTDGVLHARVETTYKNMQQDKLHGMINYLSNEKVKEYLQGLLDLPTYNVKDFKYTAKKDIYPEIEEELDIYVDGYATLTGKRLFLTPNLLNKSGAKLSTTERKTDYCLYYEYKDIDSVHYTLPAGFTAESVPGDVNIKTKYGSYSSSVKLEDNVLTYVRVMEQYAGRYSPKEYNDIVKYYADIYKADRSKIVLVKNESEQPPAEKKQF